MRQNDNIKEVRPERGNQRLARGNALGMRTTHKSAQNGQKHYYHIAMLLPILGVLHHHSGPRALPRAVCSLPILGDKHHEITCSDC